MLTLLFTGGTGYIGSHTAVEFIQVGYEIVVLDNLSNSTKQALDNIASITNVSPVFYQGDISDKNLLSEIFTTHKIDTVIHFAGSKAVGESCKDIAKYHRNNVAGSIELFATMEEFGVRNIIFSSTATVYDPENNLPMTEGSTEKTINPYGTTKLVIEKLLQDYVKHAGWNALSLRYFNPVGAHTSGLLGENPQGLPNNLMPYILQVVEGKRSELTLFGDDYETPDGTGIRDYVHVMDLAIGHLKALEYISQIEGRGVYDIFNLGTGKGTSVLEFIRLTEEILGKKIPVVHGPRRFGDVAELYCDPKKAKEILKWETKYLLKDAIEDSLKFIKAI